MSNVQSLERALTLLNVLSDYPDGIQITRLSDQVGLSKSTTHRLLSTLLNMNYVVKDGETEKYKLGYQLIYLSRNILSNVTVIQIARPFLERLSEDVNETIHLCIEDKGKVMYVDKIESNQTIRMYSRIGSKAPMYCTGVGKILLSGMSEAEYEEVVSKIDFISKTAKTITTKEGLKEEVETVKKQGYALDNIENEEDIRCIAVPIWDFQGKVIASFSISGPSNRITMERVNDELVKKARDTSINISRHLGYRD
ncbi:IclR family transcriptional regulator [Peribacillus loiseleuriae]|uniref:Glycerol operon regulatory protein n=1 Tax=Peribacillus loiseleuriae TaxID=1679170 RepID=A0A0K9GR56_9BACI|nr:IclR family transcriptional regulator [Peribacillus loiseleuriae]KMY48757.1 IclR family transcriptional regulator [Peribacillus loiseleuriae]